MCLFMDSPGKIETLIRSTANTIGLGRDSVASLRALANDIDAREPRLEETLERIESPDAAETMRLRAMRKRLESGPFLD